MRVGGLAAGQLFKDAEKTVGLSEPDRHSQAVKWYREPVVQQFSRRQLVRYCPAEFNGSPSASHGLNSADGSAPRGDFLVFLQGRGIQRQGYVRQNRRGQAEVLK